MNIFRIMSLFTILTFSVHFKPVNAEQQFVNIILNLPNAEHYGYFVRVDHGGIQILEGQDLTYSKFFTFQTKEQMLHQYRMQRDTILPLIKEQCLNFDEEAQQFVDGYGSCDEHIKKNTPMIKLIIDNSWSSSWSSLATLKEKKILIEPVSLGAEQIIDEITKNSYVCTLHVEKGQKPGFTQHIHIADDTKCIQITRGQASSIYP